MSITPVYIANLYPSTPTLSVNQFIPRTTPGNVAICLCGGGSRALTAGMGQLRALETLGLINQTKAVSTVSGGSWMGVTYVYLTPSTSDVNFLGTYTDPSKLTPVMLQVLPNGNIGSNITSWFTLEDLALKALFLGVFCGVSPDMLWQTVIGLHLLAPYGLYPSDDWDTPTSTFTFNAAAKAAIVNQNASLQNELFSTVAQVPNQQRPYLICNMGMFVNKGGAIFLAPVQATPFFTGIVSTPGATDTNGDAVGGGGVASFAFNSQPVNTTPPTAMVTQTRQWSLMDAVGTSSCAFAATLEQISQDWMDHPEKLAAQLKKSKPGLVKFLGQSGIAEDIFEDLFEIVLKAAEAGIRFILKKELGILDDLIPTYQYWPVSNVPSGETVLESQFADGGSLENTGILGALSYSDVQNVIAFINSETPLQQIGNDIVVDDQIPPLFGYETYNNGYKLYQGDLNPTNPLFQFSQVFDSAQFQTLCTELWKASGSGSFKTTPIHKQTLVTQQNNWFGIAAGRTVNVLWVYLEKTKDWYDALPADIQALLGPFHNMNGNFPHFSTFQTELTATQINLISNLSCWTVLNNSGPFEKMYC